MTDLDLEAIKARAEAANGGPWKDAEFVAHARTDVPALIAEVKRLRKRQKIDDDMIDAAIMGYTLHTWKGSIPTEGDRAWVKNGWDQMDGLSKTKHRNDFRAALKAALGENK